MVKPKQIKPVEEVLAEEDAINALRIQQNQEYEKSLLENLYNTEQNIPMPVPSYRSAEEEAGDVILQQQTALNNLKQIMKQDDAMTALGELRESGDIVDFNRFFELLKRDISGVKTITPVVFTNIWTRFKEKLNKSGDTGVFLSAEPGEYKTALDNILKSVSGIPTITGGPTTTGPTLSTPITAPISVSLREINAVFKDMLDVADNMVNLMDTDRDKFNELFERYLTKEDEKDGKIKIIGVDGSEKTYELKKDKANKNYIEPIMARQLQYMILQHFGIPLGKSVSKLKPYKLEPGTEGLNNPKPFVSNAIREKLIRAATASPTATITSGPTTPTTSTTPTTPTTPTISTSPVSGTGVDIARSCPVEVKNISPTDKIDFTPNFGAYYISISHLRKGVLCVYSNKTRMVKSVYAGPITSILQNILMGMVFDNKFDEKAYNNLDDEEKNIMDDLLQLFTKTPKKYNKISQLEKITYKRERRDRLDRDEDIKRFKLLKSHIMAGNNNPEVIRELKLLLVQLRKKEYITLRDYNNMLEVLFVLT